MQRWEDMEARGFVMEAGLDEDVSVACLKGWCAAAAADLELAEALEGRSLGPDERLNEVLASSVRQDGPDGAWQLNR